MELFKYNKQDPEWLDGEGVSGWESLVWTERYREPGEFEIITDVNSKLRETLHIGSFISHTGTFEIMIVENHSLVETPDETSKLSITGRSLPVFFDERIVGQKKDWSTVIRPFENYEIPADKTWTQAENLINDHNFPAFVGDDGDYIPVFAMSNVDSIAGVEEERVVKRGGVYTRALEILEIENLGLRTVRRNFFDLSYPWPGQAFQTMLMIHDGNDRRNEVKFSTQTNDFDQIEFLWTLKSFKNAALITSKFFEVFINISLDGFEKRVAHIDASDLDNNLNEAPTGADETKIKDLMIARGWQAIRSRNKLMITRTDLSPTNRYRYRVDYDIGDLVSIDHNFTAGNIQARVIEHVEIVDENGETSHPTLEIST